MSNPSSQLVSVRRLIAASVTIPAVASAVSIASLVASALSTAGESDTQVVGWRISDHLADRTTKRPAVCIGHTVATCISAYAQDVEVFPPVCDTEVVVGGIAGAITGAVIEVYLK
jgi:hypothetical protein